MLSTMAASVLTALTLSSLLLPTTAQTYSSCNPLVQGGCAPDPALGKSVNIQFSSGASSDFTASGAVSYTSNGAAFTISQHGDAPTLSSNWYIMFGHVDYVIQTAPGTGIVSAAVLQSDDLDEIDWEWLGGDDTQAQSNYFGKGITTTGYNRGAYHGAANNHDEFHTYSIDWTADQIVWSIDGQTVRAMTQAEAEPGQYPQTPMYVKLGTWAGGDPSNPAGTIQWAGGETDYSTGPFTMYVKTIAVTDYSTGSQYSYSGTSGTWQSISSNGGQINGKGNGAPASSGSAPSVTSSVPNTAPLAFGNGGDGSSQAATRTGWPWSGTATATVATAFTSTSPSLSSSSLAASPSASVSALLETTTSYNQQGFPIVITFNPAAPTCYDEMGFLGSCATASSEQTTTQASETTFTSSSLSGQSVNTESGAGATFSTLASTTTESTPISPTVTPSVSTFSILGSPLPSSSAIPAAESASTLPIVVTATTSTLSASDISSSPIPASSTSQTTLALASTATESTQSVVASSTTGSPSTSLFTASTTLFLTTITTDGSTFTFTLTSSAFPSETLSQTAQTETVVTSNGSTFTIALAPVTNSASRTLPAASSSTLASSSGVQTRETSTTVTSSRHGTTLSTSSHTSGRTSATTTTSSTASGTPPAVNAARRIPVYYLQGTILLLSTILLFLF